jgi:ferric-dicitrate binding protein FerR (iron transport regulator)
MTDQERFIALMIKHLCGELDAAGQDELSAMLDASPERRAYFDEYTNVSRLQEGMRLYYASRDNAKRLWETLQREDAVVEASQKMEPVGLEAPGEVGSMVLAGETSLQEASEKAGPPGEAGYSPVSARVVHMLRRWGWVAACGLVLLAAGIYFQGRDQERHIPVSSKTDVAPGGNKAILTLADGSVVTLDSAGHRTIMQGLRQTGGRLQYDARGNDNAGISYNTLATPRGGQFQVELPDGTVVWLNAASSLRYPTAFTGKERRVEVTGEAYFEVAKNAELPFRVNVDDRAEIEVLGTRFNVNAYKNEKHLKATLLQGSVRVNRVVLKPGQQALLAENIQVVNDPDLDKVMAWKNGVFNFEDASLEEVMRQLERWYDIQVVYENGIPNIRFGGKMSRNKTLGQLLRNLQDVGVHFRIEGEKLIVTR